MSAPTPLRNKDMTPEILVQQIAEEAPALTKLYAVGVAPDGTTSIWHCGDLQGLGLAVLTLQHAGHELLNDPLADE